MFAGTQLISQSWGKKKDNCEMCLDSRGINICEVRSVKMSEKNPSFLSVTLLFYLLLYRHDKVKKMYKFSAAVM